MLMILPKYNMQWENEKSTYININELMNELFGYQYFLFAFYGMHFCLPMIIAVRSIIILLYLFCVTN